MIKAFNLQRGRFFLLTKPSFFEGREHYIPVNLPPKPFTVFKMAGYRVDLCNLVQLRHWVCTKYIWCTFNAYACSINFLPCPRPFNKPLNKLYSNQVLLFSQFGIDKSCSLTPQHFTPHCFFTVILYNYNTIGTRNYRLPFVLLGTM